MILFQEYLTMSIHTYQLFLFDLPKFKPKISRIKNHFNELPFYLWEETIDSYFMVLIK